MQVAGVIASRSIRQILRLANGRSRICVWMAASQFTNVRFLLTL
jgi:hypothetical protein